jgi:hypothetical protein
LETIALATPTILINQRIIAKIHSIVVSQIIHQERSSLFNEGNFIMELANKI